MLRILIATWLMALEASAADTSSSPVTFNKDVLPILQRNCQVCHRPGEVAPMSFLTYESTRPWAKAIKAAVLAKKMPPWLADPRYGHFSNSPKLTSAETGTLISWGILGRRKATPRIGLLQLPLKRAGTSSPI